MFTGTGLPSTEEGFAEVLAALMAGEVAAEEAVRRWAALCRGRAEGLREEAGGQLQRAARYMHLRDEVHSAPAVPHDHAAPLPDCMPHLAGEVELMLNGAERLACYWGG